MKELPANFQPLHINWLSVASYLAKLSFEQLGRDLNQLPKFECASSDADLSRPLDQSSSSLQCGLESRKGCLKSGQYDTMKGSFYATIMHSYLQFDHHNTHRQPIFEWSNIWPPECLLPGFREAFEELCTMIIAITLLVAKACDQFAVEFVEGRLSLTNHQGEYDDSCSTLALFSPIRTLTPCRRRRRFLVRLARRRWLPHS